MGFFKTLFYKIGKAYKEVNWLRWVTLMVVFIAVELAILIPYYSSLDETASDSSSVSIESSLFSESLSELEDSSSSLIIVDSESSKEDSSSVAESSSSEESSSEESSSEEESSSAEESSSQEESSSVEESSDSSSSEEESSSQEDSSSVEESSDSSSSEEESSSEAEECEHSFTWSSSDVVWEDCENDGGIWATCKKCGKKEFTVGTPALGHDFENGVCTRCDAVEVVDSSEENSSEESASSETDSGDEDSSTEAESSSEGDSSTDESSSVEDASSDEELSSDSASDGDGSSNEDSSVVVIGIEDVLDFGLSSDGTHYICNGFREEIDKAAVRNVVIPDTYNDKEVKEIAVGAFNEEYGLTSLTIGANVTKIGAYAFSYCFNLVEVYNLSALNIYDGTKNGGLTSYVKNIYSSLTQTSSISYVNDFIVYTNGQEKILIGYKGNGAALTIPDGITTINPYAFAVNKNVQSIVVSDSVKTISSSAFANCTSLEKVTIGNGVTSIGSYAFYNTALEEVIFPEGEYTWSYVLDGGGTEDMPAEYLYSDAQGAADLLLERCGKTWTHS